MTFSFLEKSKFWIIAALLAGTAAVWFGAPGTVYRMVIATERLLAGTSPQAETIGDERWAYLSSDDADNRRPVLLLLHGFGADKDNFNRVARHLKQDFTVVQPDLPGFGLSSSALDNRYTAIAQANRVLAFMDHHGYQQFHVGGNSMGGYVALALAALAPERVQSLWLLAPAGVNTPPLSPFVQSVLDEKPNVLIPGSAAEFDQMLDLVFSKRPFMPAPVVQYLGRSQALRKPRLEAIFADLKTSTPAEQLAPQVTAPTFIVWGADDEVLHPSGAETLGRLIANSQVRVLPGVGHLPQLEAPKQIVRDYLDWIADA
ncbi:MAG: alpha/beta fold hydrolase [Lysobacterales bacterium]